MPKPDSVAMPLATALAAAKATAPTFCGVGSSRIASKMSFEPNQSAATGRSPMRLAPVAANSAIWSGRSGTWIGSSGMSSFSTALPNE